MNDETKQNLYHGHDRLVSFLRIHNAECPLEALLVRLANGFFYPSPVSTVCKKSSVKSKQNTVNQMRYTIPMQSIVMCDHLEATCDRI